MEFDCEKCKIRVRSICLVGNRWDGRKWSWNYCCKCYLENREDRDWFIVNSCEFCFSKTYMVISNEQRQLRLKKKEENALYLTKLAGWKLKGFDHIPEDITSECFLCKKEFCFSIGEQVFYKKKGLLNRPRKCSVCRKLS